MATGEAAVVVAAAEAVVVVDTFGVVVVAAFAPNSNMDTRSSCDLNMTFG